MSPHSPEIGYWYRHIPSATRFEVVALDEAKGTIEIQFTDGDLDELEWDDWQIEHYVPSPPPDDALVVLGMDPKATWDDEMLPDNPLFDPDDHYNWHDNTDFQGI